MAVKEKAREVRFERNLKECAIRYWAKGKFHEMGPAPHYYFPKFTGETSGFANLVAGSPLWPVLRRLPLLRAAPAQQDSFALRVGEATLEVKKSIRTTRWGNEAIMYLPEHALDAEYVDTVIESFAATKAPVMETGIQHVCQGKKNCAVATLAMIGGITYEATIARRSGARAAMAPRLKEMLALLEQFTQTKWKEAPLLALPRRLDQVTFPDWPVVVYIRPAWRFWQVHCILVKGEFVHDPNEAHAVPLDQYELGDWRIMLILQPTGTIILSHGAPRSP
jgi:hypothetical protein